MTRPTMEELRTRHGPQGGSAPSWHWSKRYGGEPGTGPAGKTCADCVFLRNTGNTGMKSHPKCGKFPYTAGDATTIRVRSAACHLFMQGEERS